MALTPQNEEAFFREVDEELRREQLGTLWHRYGKLAIAVVLLGLAALAGFLWWEAESAKRAGADGEQFAQVLADLGVGKEAGVQPKLDALAASPRGGYRAGARFTKAALALQKGDTKAAIAQYKLAAADADLAKPFRDLALVRQTALEFDTLPPGEVVARLKHLAVAGNPWFGSAGEMVAMAYLKMGKRELAGPLFAAIGKDRQVPETIRGRAERMAGVLGLDVTPQPATMKD